jgi:hypothetical protein
MDVLRGLLPGKAAGGAPPADWDTLQASCAVFFALWAFNQLLFRALGFNSGKAGDLCVPTRAKRAVGAAPRARAAAVARGLTHADATAPPCVAATPCPAA